ncbi:MAG: DUF1844 domain-containing protein [Phycisphaerae bacterium]|nr:DUF1844 domain-containing protein [Phycisphaerae bacterium]
MSDPQEPKIIIDTDWKAQAHAEKEKLAAKEAAARPPAPGEPGERQYTPFEDLISLLVAQTLSYMGAFPDPRTGQAVVSLEYAKMHIDMLGALEEKTKGNLAEGEEKLLHRTLTELRMEFVEVSKALADAVKQGKVKVVKGAPGATPAPASPATKPNIVM